MNTLFIPTEEDFKRWIKEAVDEAMGNHNVKGNMVGAEPAEALLTRKEVAAMFRVSIVTLHTWMNLGLPCHKQQGRVYFLRSEIIDYLKGKERKERELV